LLSKKQVVTARDVQTVVEEVLNNVISDRRLLRFARNDAELQKIADLINDYRKITTVNTVDSEGVVFTEQGIERAMQDRKQLSSVTTHQMIRSDVYSPEALETAAQMASITPWIFIFDFKNRSQLAQARSVLKITSTSSFQAVSYGSQLWVFSRAIKAASLDLNRPAEIRITKEPASGQQLILSANGVTPDHAHLLIITAALLLLKNFQLPGIKRSGNIFSVSDASQFLNLTSHFAQVLGTRAQGVQLQARAA